MLHSLVADRAGSMAVETAIIAPVLALMSLGTFQVSALVARQQELQLAAAQAAGIAMASAPDSDTKRATVKNILKTQLGLSDSQVQVVPQFRCDQDPDYVDAFADCSAGSIVASYLKISINDTYTPGWVSFGIGAPVNLTVVRTVQFS